MLVPSAVSSPLEILLQIIANSYLNSSYCVTIVSDFPLDVTLPTSFTYISPYENENLVKKILEVSDMGCSDYIIQMENPQVFMVAYEEVNHIGIVRRSDRKIIFLPFDSKSTDVLMNILTLKPTSFVANILLVMEGEENTAHCKSYDLVTHQYVGPDVNVNQPLYLDKWDSCSESFENNNDLFPHDISNLYGKTVRVAAFTYKPYSLLDLDTKTTPLGRDGTEIKIVDEFCRWINCTIEIVRDDEFEWGEIYDNRTGVGVLGNVVEDRADMGISALYSWYDEYIHLDFSSASIRTGISCIAPTPRLLASWEMPLLPFSWEMWYSLIGAFVYASLALSIAQGMNSDGALLATFGMMVTQSQNSVGETWRIRGVTGWMLVTGLVLDNAYGAGLASTFTVPKYEPSIDTVQDIVDRKMEWGATHDAWIFSLTLSPEPLIKQLVSQFHIYKAEELKRRSFKRNMAFSIEKLPAGYFAIGEYITKEAVLDLMLMKEDFYYEQCVVMLRKSSPYTNKISDFIGRLHESGIQLAWETQVALKHLNFKIQLEVKLSRSKQEVQGIEPLSFRHVVGLFYIYLIGIGAAGIVFLFEICSKKERPVNPPPLVHRRRRLYV